VVLSLISYFAGDSILLYTSNAQAVTHDIHPQLFNIVEEMKIAASLPVMPRIYIIDDPSPNAFATGRDPQHSSIAVTSGLLSGLNRDELQGVVAHEMSHILNRDISYLTFAGVMLGSIAMISQIFLRGSRFGGCSSRRYRSGGSGCGQAQLIIFIIAIVFAILAPILARIFYFALSRKREYLADASGARLTRYPSGLASALEKIGFSNIKLSSTNNITAPMYIVNPLQADGYSGIFSTHPPIQDRIKILRGMAGGASYLDYSKAFSAVKGGSGGIIPSAALSDSASVPIRDAGVEKEAPKDPKDKTRETIDLLRAVNNYAFLTCACGLKIKFPKNFAQNEFICPRCGRKHEVPSSNNVLAAAVASAIPAKPVTATAYGVSPQVYARKNVGWESFNCSGCGALLQLSPAFIGTSLACHSCGKEIKIR